MVRVILTGLLLLLLLFPVGRTAAAILKRKKDSLLQLFVLGAVWEAALFQLVSVILIFLNAPTRVLAWLFFALSLPEIVWGFVLFYRDFKGREDRTLKKQLLLLFLPLLVLVFFQAYSSASLMHPDSDDAEVVSLVTDAVQNDTMLRADRERGGEVPLKKNIKRVVSPYSMLEASISILTGLHPAIVCHTLMPFLLIPLCYAALFCLGKELFPGEEKKTALFLLFLNVIYLVSSYSEKNAGYFFLVRTWQGKAMMQVLLVPVLVWLTLNAVRFCGERNRWVSLFLAAMGGCLLTNLSFVVGVLIIGAGMLAASIRERRLSPMLYGLFSMSPILLYGGIFAGFVLRG